MRTVLNWSLVVLAMLVAAPASAETADEVKAWNQAGVDVNAALKKLNKRLEFAGFEGEPAPGWTRTPLPSQSSVQLWRLEPVSPLPSPGAQLLALARRQETLEHHKLKIVELRSVEAERVVAAIRMDIIGVVESGQRVRERATFEATFQRAAKDLELTDLKLETGEASAGSGALFVERAAELGLRYVGAPDPRFLPPSEALRYQVIRHAVGGAATGDGNGDGYPDLFLTSGGAAAYYRNKGGKGFEDVTEAVGLAGIEHAGPAVFADFDNDGDPDLFVGRFYGANLLLRNDGGRFTDVTAASGLAADDMTAVAVASDLNGDGFLDLYLGRFLDARDQVPDMILYSRNGAPNRLYLGGGDLHFTDHSAASGADDRGLTLGIAAADLDRDGDQDLYLSNDYGRNVLLINRGDGTFDDQARDRGALAISGGMSASVGDADGDGELDLYVSSIGSNQRWFSRGTNIRAYVTGIVQSQRRERLQALFLDLRRHLGDDWDRIGQQSLAGNYLLRGKGGGRFEDVSDASGVRPPGWYWSSGLFDLDLDGDEDIVALNGWITGKDHHDL